MNNCSTTNKGKIVVNVKRKNAMEIFDFVNSHLTMMENCTPGREFVLNEPDESNRIVLPEPKKKSGAEYLARFLPEVETCTAEEEFLCPICREIVVVNEVVRRLRCGHAFHGACVDRWLDLRRDDLACPICRRSGYDGE